jgi:hypothetical protein
MKKNILCVVSVLIAILTITGCASSGGLGSFASTTKMGPVAVPYTSVTSYYGYAKPGAEPDATIEGRKTWFIYVWVPAIAPELGIRMISPVPNGMTPKDADFVSPLYEQNKNSKSFFDTWISFEKAEGVGPENIAGATSARWTMLGNNDDSSEMPPNPSGSKYNSLLRVDDPTKLIRGLYRVGFTTYKKGEVEGTFLAQLGSPIALPGVVVGTDLKEVADKVNQK